MSMTPKSLENGNIEANIARTNPTVFSKYECEGWDSNPISSGDVSRKSLFSAFFALML
jgi:hypothetical protein